MPSGASPLATSASAARTLSAWATFGATLRPEPEVGERRLAVDAGRHRVDERHGEVTVAEQAGEIEPGRKIDRRRSRVVRDQHEAVAEQVAPGARGEKAGASRRSIQSVLAERKTSAGAPSSIWRASAEEPA